MASMVVRNNSSRQLCVSFPEKHLKIVATRGEIFSLKFTKYRLAAGLRLDPLGELKCSPDPVAVSNSLSYDIVRFKIEVGVKEKLCTKT